VEVKVHQIVYQRSRWPGVLHDKAPTEIPEELATSGRSSSSAARATIEQAVPSADQKESTTVETNAE
jgi:hypothetical protein